MLTTLLAGTVRNLARTATAAVNDVVSAGAHLVDLVGDRLADRRPADGVLRVAVVILSDENGPLCDPADVLPALQRADTIFAEQAGIRVRTLSVRVVAEKASDRALDPHANQGLLLDDIAGHTEIYRRYLPDGSGIGAPITVVVVRNIAGRTTGCSLGMTADWVICQASLFKSSNPNSYDETVLAHELAHAMNLPHHKDNQNLLFPSSSPPHKIRGTRLRPWQRQVLLANRHTLPAGRAAAALKLPATASTLPAVGSAGMEQDREGGEGGTHRHP